MGFLRRLRGLLGIATTWGIAFSIVMTTLLVGRWAVGFPHGVHLSVRLFAIAAIEFFLMGGLAGTLFSLFFARGERRQTLETLSMPRVALWGVSWRRCSDGRAHHWSHSRLRPWAPRRAAQHRARRRDGQRHERGDDQAGASRAGSS